MSSLILYTVIYYVRPILFLLAAWLFFRGHNAPGGGFIAGLVTATPVLLIYISRGRLRRFREDAYVLLVGTGLAIGLATALAPTFLGHEFFTHTFEHVHVPLIGDIELATAALFDLGVFLVVVGNVVTVIRAMTDPDH
jgi:multicomponent K+:H+ antiporter subunit A